jgi:hypothetical protein
MTKAIKIAFLYWLRQALRAFCPHSNSPEARRIYRHVCPTCTLGAAIDNHLSLLCGMQAIYQIRKCDLCHEPLSKQEIGVHAACAERENFLAQRAA